MATRKSKSRRSSKSSEDISDPKIESIHMRKSDPGLKYLLGVGELATFGELADASIFTLGSPTDQTPKVTVFVQFRESLADIEAAGFETRSVAGDVAVGEVTLNKLDALEALESVVRMEASRVLHQELDLALPEIRADVVHTGPPGNRGSGVIIGIIDTGIDYQHPSFRRNDGTSRILAIWDQSLVPQGTENNPTGFTYGVEYTQADIDAALTSPNPLNVVRHQDIAAALFHGTHVAGIAAGDGSVAGQGRPANTFIGVAPEADIVVVANTRGRAAGERGLGDSADTLDAVQYIFNFAATLRRPVVINQSQGDNVGAHDGTSLLERGFDNLLGGPGRSFVKSAGNEGSLNCHASGTVPAGGAQTPSLNMPNNRVAPVTIDIWYRAADRFDFSITPPGGAASVVVNPGNTTTLNLPNGNQVFVDSVINSPGGNGDNRIFIMIQRGTQGAVQAGNWTLTLQGTTVTLGQWDAWIQRGNPRPQFLAPFVNPARTISVPGTAAEVITVASYVTRGAGVGSISTFSSLGPTRDGRQAPTIAAPGEDIMSSLPPASGDNYGLLAGTSMAAPMVTGTVALMLERNANFTQNQIRDCLTSTARSDAFTGATPNNAWGAGKLDTAAAFNCAAPPPPRTFAPPCPPRTFAPPCPPRTLLPPCPPRTFAPPCPPRTFAPPCPPRTFAPPCPPRTFAPPCPPLTRPPFCPLPTLGPDCPRLTMPPSCPLPTLGPDCPQPTLGPGCPQPTLGPGCPQPTLGPGCPQPTLGPCGRPGPLTPFMVQPEYSSGGWWGYPEGYGYEWSGWSDPYQSQWANDPYQAQGWFDPYTMQFLGYGADMYGTDWSGAGEMGMNVAAYGSDIPQFWYGNGGY